MSAVQDFWKHYWKRRNCSLQAISPFPIVFSTRLENFLPFSSNLKLSSANSFSWKSVKFVVWERVKNLHNVVNKIIGSSGSSTLYHKIRKKKPFKNIVRKVENAGNQHFLFFSSPEHKVLMVSFCDRPMSGVRLALSVVHNFFKHLLLLNHWANLDETWQECSLG